MSAYQRAMVSLWAVENFMLMGVVLLVLAIGKTIHWTGVRAGAVGLRIILMAHAMCRWGSRMAAEEVAIAEAWEEEAE